MGCIHDARPRASIIAMMPALGRASWKTVLSLCPPEGRHNGCSGGKSEFQGYNVKMTRRSRAPGKDVHPRAPPAAFGLPRPSVYSSPQAAGGALGAGIFPGSLDRPCHFVPQSHRGQHICLVRGCKKFFPALPYLLCLALPGCCLTRSAYLTCRPCTYEH